MHQKVGLLRLERQLRLRKIAVLVDGGFFLKRLKQWPLIDRTNPEQVADAIELLCKRHVQALVGENYSEPNSRWHDHTYRLFYYDAAPYEGAPHNPISNRQENFAKSTTAEFRKELFRHITARRKFALRLGSTKPERKGYWRPAEVKMKALLSFSKHADYLSNILQDPGIATPEQTKSAMAAIEPWRHLSKDDVVFPVRQKGVDMRIGLDITTMTLKAQADTIVLITGDSDFIPAAKVARREGAEFILDPMWQSIEDELGEHIDGLESGFPKPGSIDKSFEVSLSKD